MGFLYKAIDIDGDSALLVFGIVAIKEAGDAPKFSTSSCVYLRLHLRIYPTTPFTRNHSLSRTMTHCYTATFTYTYRSRRIPHLYRNLPSETL
ncbi:hypothetical protein E2C01_003238 [Portunus trituberculatus]|uniref:Uncharacterized protein n=1 Tax=Portunus trituberculatus TaxID=210409 RepID=A0A5B7CP90_PORTR|nr:hypothetical protein [Portunus trituberculatus]